MISGILFGGSAASALASAIFASGRAFKAAWVFLLLGAALFLASAAFQFL